MLKPSRFQTLPCQLKNFLSYPCWCKLLNLTSPGIPVTMQNHPALLRPLLLLWFFTFIAIVVQAASGVNSSIAVVFATITALVWASLICLPVLALVWLSLKFAVRSNGAKIFRWAVLVSSYLLIVFLIANFKLYSLYGFYTNYFVLNLVTTTGGVEAMGISDSTWISAIAFILLGSVAYYACVRFLPIEKLWPRRLSRKWLLSGLMCCLVAESTIYVYADYVNIVPVLNTADRIIWYVPVTADSFLTNLGVPRTERFEDELSYSASAGNLAYFDEGLLTQTAIQKDFNIVWLVAESWRADTVTEKVMPNTFAFASNEQWFQNHYSGGNGTRMGLFTQFYGLYGHYWFDVLRNRQPPLLLDQLRAQGYEFGAFTSSAFTYPEFDKTVFSAVPAADLQEFNEGHGWERDQKNTTDLVQYIKAAKSPFFAFMFFESAHANYYFPDEDIIEPDYLKDFNYLTVDIEANMPAIKARYLNATHHLDRQLARVYQTLEENDLMDNTIVIITGDHGEEFMENNRWGHNSTFSQQQIRVPFIMHIPERAAAQFQQMTSHLDVPATVFAALGATADPARYSFGTNLFADDYTREFLVVSDWHGNTVVTRELKIIFSLKGAAYDAQTTDIADNTIDLRNSGFGYQDQLAEYLSGQNRFFQ